MKPLLEIKNLNINYKNSIKAVKDINFTLEDNQIISIVGESGSGKSTLIRAILKLLPMGGEAQRIKLATELSKMSKGNTVYILDEPTTGLHFQDIKKLLEVLNRLLEKGNTVIIIEHNLDVIKTADHIIDIGVDGGENGGTVVATGTPEEIAKSKKSYTGKYIAKILKSKKK